MTYAVEKRWVVNATHRDDFTENTKEMSGVSVHRGPFLQAWFKVCSIFLVDLIVDRFDDFGIRLASRKSKL